MNDDTTISPTAPDAPDANGSNPVPEGEATGVPSSADGPLAQDSSEGDPIPRPEAVPLSPDPPADPDSDPGAPLQKERRDELASLREQLSALRAELDALKAPPSPPTDTELLDEDFRTLYPEVGADALSDRVRALIAEGVPPAAAYALEERRKELLLQEAARAKLQSTHRSAGSVGGAAVTYFTPSEVKAMTHAEVRKNFSVILDSMKKWH